ncbi:MFS transporter [Plantactinospora siamensis]|uniref:MFS transporter n=1 Tax=Plantactinospora siamensis TaxID=555372 RepID=A0ABV6P6H6_9ACTN
MARRAVAMILAIGVLALGSLAWSLPGARPAAAAASTGLAARAPADLCKTTKEWQADFQSCVKKLTDTGKKTVECADPPVPSAPDSGLAGWFVSRPDSAKEPGPQGLYSTYGYAGYGYSTYDVDGGCASSLIHPDYRFTTTVANGEFMMATSVIGASNALRERAWEPKEMWGWADPLVEQATKAVYQKVFSVFGIITLCVVGLYLMWRSRQSDMSNAMTTAGWALLVMVAVTALAAWPVRSANLADGTLVTALGAVHDAVGPRPQNVPPGQCDDPTPGACNDHRPPAVRASDTATETMLYRNWLRGVLGSADSETAQKYGRALYDARSLSWEEAEKLRSNPDTRKATIDAKQLEWMKVAAQIQKEDPEAYEYLQGTKDMERIGAGFIALLAAVLFALFDLTASILVLLGFLIFRWAVIAAPVLGTVGLLRPASAGLRRLGNAVVAALFNIAIFGTGAAIYLFAVDLVMSTPTLPGWLQVVLVALSGVVGWLLLRPFQRITQLGGKDRTEVVIRERWHQRFMRDLRDAARPHGEPDDRPTPLERARRALPQQPNLRPEARLEDPTGTTPSRAVRESSSLEPAGPVAPAVGAPAPGHRAPVPRRRQPAEWTEPDVPDAVPSYSVYRPGSTEPEREPEKRPRIRSEAR